VGDTYPRLRVAAVQAAPVFLDREATVEKTCRLIEEAAKKDAKIVGFSECFVPGYPHWVDWAKAKDRPKAAERYLQLFKNAIEVPSPATEQLCETAKQNDCYVVVGINEKEKDTMGTLYNSQLFISRNGTLLGKRRKLVPTYGERFVYQGGDGTDLPVFQTDYGRLGALICGEHSNPLAKFTLLAKGEALHVASWPALTMRGDFIPQQCAFEGRLFIISASDIFTKEVKEYLGTDAEGIELGGGTSGIYGPQGDIIAKAAANREEIIYAQIDLEEIVRAKMLIDVVGHYNRFDIFQLCVNEQKQQPMRILQLDQDQSEQSAEFSGLVTKDLNSQDPSRRAMRVDSAK
jgi:predicted amidohydrolase